MKEQMPAFRESFEEERKNKNPDTRTEKDIGEELGYARIEVGSKIEAGKKLFACGGKIQDARYGNKLEYHNREEHIGPLKETADGMFDDFTEAGIPVTDEKKALVYGVIGLHDSFQNALRGGRFLTRFRGTTPEELIQNLSKIPKDLIEKSHARVVGDIEAAKALNNDAERVLKEADEYGEYILVAHPEVIDAIDQKLKDNPRIKIITNGNEGLSEKEFEEASGRYMKEGTGEKIFSEEEIKRGKKAIRATYVTFDFNATVPEDMLKKLSEAHEKELKNIALYGRGLQIKPAHLEEGCSLEEWMMATVDLPGQFFRGFEVYKRNSNNEFRELNIAISAMLQEEDGNLSDENKADVGYGMLKWLKDQVAFIMHQKESFLESVDNLVQNKEIQGWEEETKNKLKEMLTTRYAGFFDESLIHAKKRFEDFVGGPDHAEEAIHIMGETDALLFTEREKGVDKRNEFIEKFFAQRPDSFEKLVKDFGYASE